MNDALMNGQRATAFTAPSWRQHSAVKIHNDLSKWVFMSHLAKASLSALLLN